MMLSLSLRGRRLASALFFLVAAVPAQGPGSCGVHLDVLAPGTSTYAAIADVPGAPGSSAGIPPGAPGNPYSAYAPQFSIVRLRLTVAPGTLGGAPFGAGSVISIFWSMGTPNLPLGAPPGSVAACGGGPWIISVLPLGGALLDGLGLLGPAPILLPVDPGHPGKLEISLFWPFAAAPPILFQAAIVTPGAALAVSNGVSILSGANPNETSLLPTLVQPSSCTVFPALDEGGVSFTSPPGFAFFGTPAASAVARANGFVEFGPNANVFCDYVPGPSGLGCSPTFPETSPRIAVNFFDSDLNLAASPAHPPDLTIESVPATIDSPSRTIIRWKHAVPWFGQPGPLAEWASAVCELWGADVPGGSAAVASTIVVVRQEHHVVTSDFVHGFCGIGPGDFGQGFGGPAATCTGTPFWNTYGGFPFAGGVLEAIHLLNWGGGNAGDSMMLSNLASAFTPSGPGAYTLSVH